jgi:hypothetical protein
MHSKQDTWCFKEFSSIKLGDKRLDRRLLKVASDLLNDPAKPIHATCDNWAEAKAAYRLFDNSKLEDATLLTIHQNETVKRAEKSDEILFAIQDTTVLNYTHHPKKQLNKINKNPGFEKPTVGCFLHNTLLMTESGLPLGLLDQKIYQNNSEEKINHKRRPITEKQSYKWIESLKMTRSLCSEKEIITIGDRESDIFELFAEAYDIDAKLLVRATKDRILVKDATNQDTLWKRMKTALLAGVETIKLPARHNQPERSATLEIRYATIVLKPPQRHADAKGKILLSVKMQAIWLYEPLPPAGIQRLEWMLLTNVPVISLEDAVRMGKWYRLRWQIECYHRILKSGCKIEECRLETYERLKKYLRLKSIIAFRLFWLTIVNRTNSKESCNKVLEDHEWKALYCYINKTKQVPEDPPSVRETIRMIAKLGGFLGRKHDGEPGMTYIWRGWEKLTLIAEFWLSTCYEVTYG